MINRSGDLCVLCMTCCFLISSIHTDNIFINLVRENLKIHSFLGLLNSLVHVFMQCHYRACNCLCYRYHHPLILLSTNNNSYLSVWYKMIVSNQLLPVKLQRSFIQKLGPDKFSVRHNIRITYKLTAPRIFHSGRK